MSQGSTRRLRSSNKSSVASPIEQEYSLTTSSKKRRRKRSKKSGEVSETLTTKVSSEEEVFDNQPLTTINMSSVQNGNVPPHVPQIELLDPKQPLEQSRLAETLNNLNVTLQSLQIQISQLNNFKGRLDCFSSTWKTSVDTAIENCQGKWDEQDFKLKLLSNIVINQEQKIQMLENKVNAAYKKGD